MCDQVKRTDRLGTSGRFSDNVPRGRKSGSPGKNGLTSGHGLVSGSDLKLIEVGSVVFALFASSCAEGINAHVRIVSGAEMM